MAIGIFVFAAVFAMMAAMVAWLAQCSFWAIIGWALVAGWTSSLVMAVIVTLVWSIERKKEEKKLEVLRAE